MAIGRRLLMTASRKHRQGSRFLGRRLVQSNLVPARRSWFFDRKCSLAARAQVLRRAISSQEI